MKHLLILAALLCLALPIVALAQDVTPEPTPAPVTPFPEVPPVEDIGQWMLTPIVTVLIALAVSPIGTAIIGVLKQTPLFSSLSGQNLQLLVGGVLMTLVLVARNFGYEVQLDATLDFLQKAIEIVGTLFVSIRGMQAVYNQAVKREIPVVGYKRT